MRTLHFQIKRRVRDGAKGTAADHTRYITRGGNSVEYIQRTGAYADKEDLVATGHGNLPTWANKNPVQFFEAADTWERNPGLRNGRVCVQIDATLPRELSQAEQQQAVQDFLRVQLGERHAYVWAMHESVASDGKPHPHVHMAFSERQQTGRELSPQEYFSRTNPKDRYFNERTWPTKARQAWSDTLNVTLERSGSMSRVDPRTLRAQGIDRDPVENLHKDRLRRDNSELRARPQATENHAATHAYWTARKAELGITPGMAHAEALQRITAASRQLVRQPQEALEVVQARVQALQQQAHRTHAGVLLEQHRLQTGMASAAVLAKIHQIAQDDAVGKNRYHLAIDHPGKEQTRERGRSQGW